MVLRLPLLRVSTVTVTVPSPWLAAASQGPVSIAIAPVGGCCVCLTLPPYCATVTGTVVQVRLLCNLKQTRPRKGPDSDVGIATGPLGLWVFHSNTIALSRRVCTLLFHLRNLNPADDS
jgi:hypothetical protein